MQDELEARERVAPHTQRRVPTQGKRNISTTSALFASEKCKSLVSCMYCKQAHPLYTCQVFKTPQIRKDFLRKDGRCFVCLRKGHLAKACHSTAKCLDCSGRHHLSICEKPKSKEFINLDANSKPFVPKEKESQTSIASETPTATHIGMGSQQLTKQCSYRPLWHIFHGLTCQQKQLKLK